MRILHMSAKEMKAKPPVKWVGGKGRLIEQFSGFFPCKFNRYYEPFLGGGAVFFHLSPRKEAQLNDLNNHLVTLYEVIRSDVDSLLRLLKTIENKYLSLGEVQKKDFYYEVRGKFNSGSNDALKQTAYLIFLNKTGFNGLYRVNSSGDFNVPFGRYKKPVIVDSGNLKKVSKLLQNKTLSSVDFEEAVESAKKDDFVYFDPPYHPVSETSNFTSYSKENFGIEEQKRLAETFKKLDRKGCYVMLSNSYTPFVKELYGGYRQEVVQASRAINREATGRGKIDELVILNY